MPSRGDRGDDVLCQPFADDCALDPSDRQEPDRSCPRVPCDRPFRDPQDCGHPTLMPNPALLIAFFIFVMAGVVAAGYYLLLRPASRTAGNEDQSAAQVLTDNLRSLGGALPDAKSGGALRKRLIAAGYRAPEAVDL